jgi:hypothetical protein
MFSSFAHMGRTAFITMAVVSVDLSLVLSHEPRRKMRLVLRMMYTCVSDSCRVLC